jgi:membrane associated rhomboid family serine protease
MRAGVADGRRASRPLNRGGAFGAVLRFAREMQIPPIPPLIPVRDRLPTRTFPFINYLLIVSNVLVFLWQQALAESGYEQIGNVLGFVPYQFSHDPVATLPTIFTSMFMHGGWLHLLFNMLFLWIFGDNVEDAVGHLRYVAFYLFGGAAAALTQMAVDPNSTVPMVGASGAISAVMAGYLMLYPTSPITILNPIPLLWFFFGLFIELPAWFVTLEFFAVNLLAVQTSAVDSARHGMGGVAFFAHIGGFVAGFVLVRFFMIGRKKMPADRWSGWRPPERRREGGWNDSRYYR